MIALVSVFVFQPILSANSVYASVQNNSAKPKVSFTFDDGLASASTVAQPTLAKYGLTGTDYVISGCVGMVATNNTCHANTDAIYMSWDQVTALQASGWEIGSHTVSHPYLASSDAGDGQPNVLTPQQVESELSQSKADLAAHGINAKAFSTPYGDYTPATLALIAKYYSSHRGFAEQNLNGWGYNDYLLNNMQVQAGVTVAQVEAKIDEAIATNTWLILTFHDIKARASSNPDDYEYSTTNLEQIAAYVKAKQDAGQITNTNVSAGLVTGSNTDNLLPNSSFNNGIADGWTTDNAVAITADSQYHGSYPDPTSSVKFIATDKANHLFSPKISVDFNSSYMLKNFITVSGNTGGELGFYIDEYDQQGNWVSGQYKAAERGNFVENINIAYTPTSPMVTSASLQVFVTANSTITAYLDNCQWFRLTTAIEPTSPNLLTNGEFTDDMATGWSTDDPEHITWDRTLRGGPVTPIDSVRLASGIGKTGHLFSNKIGVSSNQYYKIGAYLNILDQMSGVVGYYVDEYDANGNWISGRYLGDSAGAGEYTEAFVYKPSSASVATASLQVIVVQNSGTVAFLDNVSWTQL